MWPINSILITRKRLKKNKKNKKNKKTIKGGCGRRRR